MYIKLETFVSDDLVKKVLSKNHIVKNVTFKRKVHYGMSDGMGGFEPTGRTGTEDMTREVAIPKDNPDLVITEENYGEYQAEKVFEEIFMDKLVEIVVNQL